MTLSLAVINREFIDFTIAHAGCYPTEEEFGVNGVRPIADYADALGCESTRDAVYAKLGIDPFKPIRRAAEADLQDFVVLHARTPQRADFGRKGLDPIAVYFAALGVDTLDILLKAASITVQ